MLTLAEALSLLTRYSGANNSFTERLNLVCARLIPAGNWRLTKNRVSFNVFLRADHAAFITLPRTFNTILAGAAVQGCNDSSYGAPMPVRNGWYGFSPTGIGLVEDARYRWGHGFEPEEDRFTTFADWSDNLRLRFKFETTETAGTIIVKGTLNGEVIRTGTGPGNIEGVAVPYTGATVTTTQLFSTAPYQIVKPVTNGRVSMYTWDGTTETLVAIYETGETNPGWRRYRVPACASWTEGDPGQFITICKRAYVPVVRSNDEVIPGNIGALRFGLEALQKEDSQDWPAAELLWDRALRLLAADVADDDGAGVAQTVAVEDALCMGTIGSGYGMGGGW